MKKVLVMAISVSMLCAMACGSAVAQEEEGSYAFGEVVQITADSVTVTEVYYDDETGEEVVEQNEYVVLPDAELENIGSLTDLKEGQEIDIEYIEIDGKKQVSYIYVYAEEE